MHSFAFMRPAAADAASHDLLEVERLMANAMTSGDAADGEGINIARIAALHHLNAGTYSIRVGDLLFSAAYASRTTVDFFAVGYPIYDDVCDFEMDFDRDTAALVVNITGVLQKNNALPTHEAWEATQKLGRRHLEIAVTGSTHLPIQSGRLFGEMANALHSRLNDRCIQ